MFKVFLSAIIFLGINTTLSANGPEITSAKVPSNIHIYSEGGDAFVDLAPKGCNSTNRYQLQRSHKSFDQIYRTLVAAQLANRKVVVRFDGCINTPENPRGKIVGVFLK